MSCSKETGLDCNGWVCEKLGYAIEAAFQLPESRTRTVILGRIASVIALHEGWSREASGDVWNLSTPQAYHDWRERWTGTQHEPIDDCSIRAIAGDSPREIQEKLKRGPPQIQIEPDGSVVPWEGGIE